MGKEKGEGLKGGKKGKGKDSGEGLRDGKR
jgi:hypothetical protein